jgi:hypothetical protein
VTPHDGEILKLARVLGAPAERFGYLRQVPLEDLRRFREQVTDVLFDAHVGVLQRMASASRLLPAPLLAKMAEVVFGPLLSARIAGLVDPGRGVEIARRLSSGFLADVAAELDPRRASGIIVGLPERLVIAVAKELARREDWLTVARFVEHLPDTVIVASFGFISDDALRRIAPLLDDPARITHVVSLLPENRLDTIPGDLVS